MDPQRRQTSEPGHVIRLVRSDEKPIAQSMPESAPRAYIPRQNEITSTLSPLPKKVPSGKPSWAIMTGIVSLLVLAGVGYYYFAGSGFSVSEGTTSSPPVNAQTLIAEVGKIILLPAGETPTIATVSDMSKLAGQAFFANAMVGDTVVMYAHARRAILYRASQHKIIEVAPITLDN